MSLVPAVSRPEGRPMRLSVLHGACRRVCHAFLVTGFIDLLIQGRGPARKCVHFLSAVTGRAG